MLMQSLLMKMSKRSHKKTIKNKKEHSKLTFGVSSESKPPNVGRSVGLTLFSNTNYIISNTNMIFFVKLQNIIPNIRFNQLMPFISLSSVTKSFYLFLYFALFDSDIL